MPSTEHRAVRPERDADLIQHVSDTAFWIAAHRAAESERKDSLFHDPLARILAEGHGEKIAKEMGNAAAMAWSVAIRTCVIDDYIHEAISQGSDIVLNLGAGLDTRPYRMELPKSLSWIEIDFPSVIDFKEQKLKDETPRCRLKRIKLDLSNIEERRRIFSEINSRSPRVLIITEGVIPYLSTDEAALLARDLAEQAHFKTWITDYFSAPFMKFYREGRFRNWISENAPFRFFPDDWAQFFQSQGWRLDRMRYLAEEGQRLKRTPPTPVLFRLLSPFFPKEKKKALSEMTGIALLSKT